MGSGNSCYHALLDVDQAASSSSGDSGSGQPHKAPQNVKDSWLAVKDIGVDIVGMGMFEKLFELEPQTRLMFKTFGEDPNWRNSTGFRFHSKTVLNVIGSALCNVQSEKALENTLRTVGSAHSLFEIHPRHYDILRDGLMEELERRLKDKFTPDIRKAWETAYDNVAIAMKHYQEAKNEES